MNFFRLISIISIITILAVSCGRKGDLERDGEDKRPKFDNVFFESNSKYSIQPINRKLFMVRVPR